MSSPFQHTTDDVARKLNVHPGTIRQWADDGLLAYHELPGGTRAPKRRYSDAQVNELVEHAKVRRVKRGLSKRENQVLNLLALGHTNPEVAEALNLSVRTVESHRARIISKLKLRTRAELTAYVNSRSTES